MNTNFEKVEALGSQPPQARFGHTITYIAKNKAILFGGTATPLQFRCHWRHWEVQHHGGHLLLRYGHPVLEAS